jgi:hypothetical protein
MEPILALLCLFTTLLGFAGWILIFIRRQQSRLRSWAAENGFHIVRIEKSGFTRPAKWFWRHSHDRAVFRVRVRDREGKERTGWIRLPIWFGNQTEVLWDEP